MNAQTQITHSTQSVGLLNLESFELSQRIAKMLSTSTLVPEQYRATVQKKAGKDNEGNQLWREEANPNGLSNCIIALNMANRMGADPLMVMQNLYLVNGRPSWSSQFIMAGINSSGRFSALRFEIEDLGVKEIECTETVWENRRPKKITKKITVNDFSCVAWAIEKETSERLESSKITIEMAVKEGWYTKDGSKWQTMPEQMLRYRAASFFGRVYAPELLMGLRSAEEEQDRIIDVTPVAEETVVQASNAKQIRSLVLKAKTLDDLEELESSIYALSSETEREELIKLYKAQVDKYKVVAVDAVPEQPQTTKETLKETVSKPETAKAKTVKKDDPKPAIENQSDAVSDPVSDLYKAINDAKNLDELIIVSKQVMTAERNKAINAAQGQQIKQHYAQRKEVLAQADIFEDGQDSHLFVDKVIARILSAKNQDEINAEYANPAIEELSDQDRQRIDLAAGQRESELFG